MNIKPNPIEIINAVSKMPVYLQKEAEKGYIGLQCEWTVLFRSLYNPYKENHPSFPYDKDPSPEDELFWVTMVDLNGVYPSIYGSISLEENPELKTLHQKTKIKISGKIKEISGHSITLENLKINSIQKEEGRNIQNKTSNKTLEYIKKHILIITSLTSLIIAFVSIPWWPTWLNCFKNLR